MPRDPVSGDLLDPPLSPREVARSLGMQVQQFYRRRSVLEREAGMPKPLNLPGRSLAWDRASFLEWRARLDPARAAQLPPVPHNDDQLGDSLDTLLARRGKLIGA